MISDTVPIPSSVPSSQLQRPSFARSGEFPHVLRTGPSPSELAVRAQSSVRTLGASVLLAFCPHHPLSYSSVSLGKCPSRWWGIRVPTKSQCMSSVGNIHGPACLPSVPVSPQNVPSRCAGVDDRPAPPPRESPGSPEGPILTGPQAVALPVLSPLSCQTNQLMSPGAGGWRPGGVTEDPLEAQTQGWGWGRGLGGHIEWRKAEQGGDKTRERKRGTDTCTHGLMREGVHVPRRRAWAFLRCRRCPS